MQFSSGLGHTSIRLLPYTAAPPATARQQHTAYRLPFHALNTSKTSLHARWRALAHIPSCRAHFAPTTHYTTHTRLRGATRARTHSAASCTRHLTHASLIYLRAPPLAQHSRAHYAAHCASRRTTPCPTLFVHPVLDGTTGSTTAIPLVILDAFTATTVLPTRRLGRLCDTMPRLQPTLLFLALDLPVTWLGLLPDAVCRSAGPANATNLWVHSVLFEPCIFFLLLCLPSTDRYLPLRHTTRTFMDYPAATHAAATAAAARKTAAPAAPLRNDDVNTSYDSDLSRLAIRGCGVTTKHYGARMVKAAAARHKASHHDNARAYLAARISAPRHLARSHSSNRAHSGWTLDVLPTATLHTHLYAHDTTTCACRLRTLPLSVSAYILTLTVGFSSSL